MTDRLLTTAEAAEYMGWPKSRLHDVAMLVPRFAEQRSGGSAGRGNENLWRESILDMTKLLVSRFGLGYVPAARVASFARFEEGRIVIDPIQSKAKASVDMSIVHMA
jgi:hypothetical protein